MASSVPVLVYDRPLPPGSVRITRGAGDAVTIAVGPDTAKRALYTLTRPFIIAFAFCAILLQFRWPINLIGFLPIVAFLARESFRIVSRSAEPIVFRADGGGIQVINQLGNPADQFFGPDEIIALELNRISMVGEPLCYQLELRVRTLWKRADRQTLLVSQCDEMLDKIGRLLCASLRLPEPVGGQREWTSYRPPIKAVDVGSAGELGVDREPDAVGGV